MKPKNRQRLLVLALSIALAACGGGDGDGASGGNSGNGGGNGTPGQNAVTANIKASVDGTQLAQNAEVATSTAIALDGAGSQGSSLSYAWSVAKQPVGSDAVITNPATAQASFTPRVPGQYQLALTVSSGQSAHTATLDLVAVNSVPVAIIGGSAQVETIVGQVQLDGSGSAPPSGGNERNLKYQWRLITKPVASTLQQIADSEATRSIARFAADVEGEYKVGLIVTYGDQRSEEAYVTVQVAKPSERPVAKIAASTASGSFIRGDAITLDASASTSGSGQPLQYRWSVSTPSAAWAATGGELRNANSKEATLIPSLPGTYYAHLRVYDGIAINETRNFKIDVVPRTDVANTPPVAVINVGAWNGAAEAERNVKWNLSGSGSYDIDQIGSTGLKFEWTLLSSPEKFRLDNQVAGKDYDFTIRSSYFTTTEYGDYEFQLRVQDAAGAWSAPVKQKYTVLNGANRAPTPVATLIGSISNTVGAGQTVTFSGENSTDPENNRLTYTWTLVDRPDGSTAALSSTSAAIVNLKTDQPGFYMVSLAVTDEHGITTNPDIVNSGSKSAVRIIAKAQNHAPQVRLDTVANSWWNWGFRTQEHSSGQFFIFDKEQPLLIGKQYLQVQVPSNPDTRIDKWVGFHLRAEGYDPDSDPISYVWVLSSGPSNFTVNIPSQVACPMSSWDQVNETEEAYWLRETQYREWGCNNVSLSPATTGTYVFEMIATDGINEANPIRIALEAATRADYPTLLLEDMLSGGTDRNDNPNRGEYWDVLRKDGPAQLVFPVDFQQKDSPRGLSLGYNHIVGGTTSKLKTFRLTAFDRDYTITDVVANSPVNAAIQPRFVGLQNNQVIKKGESVEFTLVIDSPATLPAIADLAAAVNAINWGFRVAEKDGWTFNYIPYLELQ